MSFGWLRKIADIAPLILPLIPGLPPELTPYVVKGISIAETIPGASGSEKLAKAVEEVNNGVEAVNIAKPGTINASAINDAVVHGIQTVIAVTNVAHPPSADKV